MRDTPVFWRWPLLGLVLWFLTSFIVGAQDPPKQPPREDEDPGAVKKPLMQIPDDEPDPAKAPKSSNAKAAAGPLSDLARELTHATQPGYRRLLDRLLVPHDEVYFKEQPNDYRKIVPLEQYLGDDVSETASVKLKLFDSSWNAGIAVNRPRKEIAKIIPYEQLALNQVAEFLNQHFDRDTAGSKWFMARLDMLAGAEIVLAAVVRFHESEKEAGHRDGAKWADLGGRLRRRLFEVRLEELHALAEEGNWDRAFTMAVVAKAYPDPEEHKKLAEELARLVEEPLKKDRYSEAVLRFKVLEEQFPSVPATDKVSDRLRDQAKTLFEQATREDSKKALELLDQAELLWPRLAGLTDRRQELNKAHPPPLGVGVRELPEYFSPGTAVLDSERQAVELLFESLVKPLDEPWGINKSPVQRYLPGLAAERPRLIPLGRQFQLYREAYWSNGTRVTDADVRITVERLRNPTWEGYAPEWADLIDTPNPSGVPFQVDLRLRQGFLDPLSLMTFKILPASASSRSPDDPAFGQKPVGSGPYRLKAIEKDGVLFEVNPNYRRPGKEGRPRIREVRFFRSADPAADFRAGRLHLLLDLPTDQYNQVHSVATIKQLTSRRIWFLAVNHEIPMLQNEDLRRAIAHGIHRTSILDSVFRGDLKDVPDPPHHPLNSPYPYKSWACQRGLPADPFQMQLAKTLAARVKSANPKVKLRLKYPDNDPQVAKACAMIQDQLKELGFEIDLDPRAPRDWHQEVAIEHNYELAYFHYDFPSEALWLWPLFNPDKHSLGRGGRNILNYHNDGELESAFQEANGYRDFTEVSRCAHKIHSILYAKMPLIPLWQLDTFIAHHDDLVFKNLDPLLVFTSVEDWKLGKQ